MCVGDENHKKKSKPDTRSCSLNSQLSNMAFEIWVDLQLYGQLLFV